MELTIFLSPESCIRIKNFITPGWIQPANESWLGRIWENQISSLIWDVMASKNLLIPRTKAGAEGTAQRGEVMRTARFIGSPFWMERNVFCCSLKIRLSLIAHKVPINWIRYDFSQTFLNFSCWNEFRKIINLLIKQKFYIKSSFKGSKRKFKILFANIKMGKDLLLLLSRN